MTDDGRLDLDELGRVIGDADRIEPEDVVGSEPGPTAGERLEALGITPFLRRHRTAVVGVAAAALALGGIAWVRHDPRPPDDGHLRATVVDATSSDGSMGQITSYGDGGAAAATYAVVRQRASDDVRILGITGPGISTSSATEARVGGSDPDRTPFVVVAVHGCLDPRSLSADMTTYRLLVRRTDEYGRTVDGVLPLPLGSQARWDQALTSACLRDAAGKRLEVAWGRVTADPAALTVRIGMRVTNRTGATLMLWSRGWAGMTTRQDDIVVGLPQDSPQAIWLVEHVASCDEPALPEVPRNPESTNGIYEPDRGIGGMLTVASGADGAAGTDWAITWDDTKRAEVRAALRSVCAGAPPNATQFVSAGPAPVAVQRQARSSLNGDPQAVAVRAWVDVTTAADRVDVRDVQSETDIASGSTRQIGTSSAVVHGGRARVAVDWFTTCGSTPGPPTYQLVLHRGGRSWPALVNLDNRSVAFALSSVCPLLDPLSLQNAGWAHVVPGT